MPSLPFRWFTPLAGSSRPSSPMPAYVVYDEDMDDESSEGDHQPNSPNSNEESAGLLGFSLNRRSGSQTHFLLPRAGSASNSPFPSRPTSPVPPTQLPLYTSTSEDEPTSPLLLATVPYGRKRKWWPKKRKREHSLRSLRGWKRTVHRIVKHPLFPTQPLTILLTLLLATIIALLITVSLVYILNPDKWALPWRQYCSHDIAFAFPPPDFESLPPAGVFLGVFSMDAAVERRMLVRTTWASHVRSRGMDAATDRTVVRFILGKPRPEWERRVALEMSVYNDIVILPIPENMNNGKTHAYFTWAHENALVPPPNTNHTFNPVHRLPAPPVPIVSTSTSSAEEEFSTWLSSTASDTEAAIETSSSSSASSTSTSDAPAPTESTSEELANTTPETQEATSSSRSPHGLVDLPPVRRSGPAPVLPAKHDPIRRRSVGSPDVTSHQRLIKRRAGLGHRDAGLKHQEQWVSPDFVIKADDDSFVMLAELEGRLRVEWVQAIKDGVKEVGKVVDPMIFWGYLVKSRFMAGELYALSWSLVSFVATNPRLLSMTRGAEDKQTSKWIRLHPRADQVRWRSEHCWIYDHPRSGTVYSHGFLFPSEAERVKTGVEQAKELLKNATKTQKSTSMFYGSSLSPEVAALKSDAGLIALSTTSTGSSSTSGGDPAMTTPVDESPTASWDPDTWKPGPPDPGVTPLPPLSPFLSKSSVSTFGARYTWPVVNLTLDQQVEALVEGSPVSRLRKVLNATTGQDEEPKWEKIEAAWDLRESYETRYARSTLRARGIHNDAKGRPRPPSIADFDSPPPSTDAPSTLQTFGPRGIGLGGTVVVHFIKRNEWFLEAAMAMLGPNWNGDEGRIDAGQPQQPKVVDGAGKGTVIAKTQSFKKRSEATNEEATESQLDAP